MRSRPNSTAPAQVQSAANPVAGVRGERVVELETALRAVLALVQGDADALGELPAVPGATFQGLALQTQALVRKVLP